MITPATQAMPEQILISKFVDESIGYKYRPNVPFYTDLVNKKTNELGQKILKKVQESAQLEMDGKTIPRFRAYYDYLFTSFEAFAKIMSQYLKIKYDLAALPSRSDIKQLTDLDPLAELFNHHPHYKYGMDISWLADNPHVYSNKTKKFSPQYIYDAEKQLSDLWQAAFDGKVTDVVFVVEGKPFTAHKTILMLQSPTFQSMFTVKMKEGIQQDKEKIQEIEIKETDSKSFAAFLRFIYTGQLAEEDLANLETINDILFLAHRYQVEKLIHCCSDGIYAYLEKNPLNSDSFEPIFQMGVSYDDKKLVHLCFEFAQNSQEGMAQLHSLITAQNIKGLASFTLEDKFPKVQEMLLKKSIEFIPYNGHEILHQ